MLEFTKKAKNTRVGTSKERSGGHFGAQSEIVFENKPLFSQIF